MNFRNPASKPPSLLCTVNVGDLLPHASFKVNCLMCHPLDVERLQALLEARNVSAVVRLHTDPMLERGTLLVSFASGGYARFDLPEVPT